MLAPGHTCAHIRVLGLMPSSGNTSERGYGPEHQREAARLKAQLRDGDLCCRCSQPMYRWQLEVERNDVRGIDADHWRNRKPQPPDALAHRRCNRRAGAVHGNTLRGQARRARRVRELPEW